MRTDLSVVDTFNTSKREGRCRASNIHPIYPDNINLALEKVDANYLNYSFLPNNFNQSSNSSEDILLSPLEVDVDGLDFFNSPENLSDEVTLAPARRAAFCTS